MCLKRPTRSVDHHFLLAPTIQGGTTPVRVAIGNISAYCERCGCEQFLRAMASRRRDKASVVACSGCGAEYLYSTLLGQIAGRIIRHGDWALQDSERLRKRLNALAQRDSPSDYDLPHSGC